jgi:hypothetical protein
MMDKGKDTKVTKTDQKEQEQAQKKITDAPNPNTMLTVVKKIGVKNLLKIGGGTVGVAAVATVVFPVFGALMVFGLGVGSLVVMGAILYGYKMLRQSNLINPVGAALKQAVFNDNVVDVTSNAAAEEPAAKEKFKVWDNKQIPVFLSEPTMAEILQAKNSQQDEAEDLLIIEPNTIVSVLNDSGKQAVKVRILSGKHQGRVGWICKSLLVREAAA